MFEYVSYYIRQECDRVISFFFLINFSILNITLLLYGALKYVRNSYAVAPENQLHEIFIREI